MHRRGFTLPEVLIYITLFAVTSLVAVNSLLAMGRALSLLRGTRGTTDATLVAFERMTRSIQSASSVVSASSTFALHPGRLGLDTGTQFFLSGTQLMIQEGLGTEVPLMPGDVPMTSLIFRKIETVASSGVKIEAVVGGKNMYMTAVLRGSY